jgi:hypothetical protein
MQMKRSILTSLALLAPLIPLTTYASPIVISDSTKQVVTHCGYLLNTLSKVEVPVAKDADGDSYCKIDISGMPVGTNTVKLTYININPIWGRLESASSLPFTVIRPPIPSPPLNLIVTP